MVPTDLLTRVDELIELGEKALATRFQYASEQTWYVDYGAKSAFRSAVLSFMGLHFHSGHPYCKEFARVVGSSGETQVKAGLAVVKAMRDEMAGGWLVSVQSLVSADIFSDFLEMAKHLLSSNYKDAAAVMIGSVLEEHLRQLCAKQGVDLLHDVNGKMVRKDANMLNVDLQKKGAYFKGDQTQVTAWQKLRNDAAHGNYSEYQKAQIELMCQGVANFMVRNPA